MQFLNGPNDALDGIGKLAMGLEEVKALFRLRLLGLLEAAEKVGSRRRGIPIQHLAL
jgi:hypothetical protein